MAFEVRGLGIDFDAEVGERLSEVLQEEIDARAEAVGGGVPTSRTVSAGTGLTGGGNLSADRSFAVAYGSSAGTACQGNDSRLSDARTPTTHNHPSSQITDFTEAVQDAVAALLAAGTNVTLTYNDASNSLTVAASGAGGLDAEAVRDAIGVAMVGIGAITVTVNDAADTITISTTATANDTDANLRARSSHTGTQAISTVTGLQTALDGKQSLIFTNVKDAAYGALGNGSANDTAAIQAAIDAASAAGGGIVWFPAGTYNHTGLVLPDVDTSGAVHLWGPNSASVTLVNTHASNVSIDIRASSYPPGNRVSGVHGLRLITSSLSTQIAIDMRYATYFSISDVRIESHQIGLRVELCWAGSVNDLTISTCTTAVSFIDAAASTPFRFQNLVIYGCTNGVSILGNSGSGMSFSDGTIATTTGPMVYIDGFSKNITFKSVVFEKATSDNVDYIVLGDADSGPAGVLFDGCHFLNHNSLTRMIYHRYGGNLTFVSPVFTTSSGTITTAIEQGSSAGHLVLVNPRFENTTTAVRSQGVNYASVGSIAFFSGFGGATPNHLTGTASPEGSVVAPIGWLYSRTSGNTASTTLYVKTSGTGNTGWTALGSGGIVRAVSTLTTTATLGATALTDYVYFLGSGAVPTLPTAVGNNNRYTVKNTTGSAINLATTSSQTVDGAAGPVSIPAGVSYDFISDGSGWQRV